MSASKSAKRRVMDLADMDDMPMSAAWYWYLGYLRSTLSTVRTQHADTMKLRDKQTPKQRERDEVAQRLANAALETIDRHRRTMEAAGVLEVRG